MANGDSLSSKLGLAFPFGVSEQEQREMQENADYNEQMRAFYNQMAADRASAGLTGGPPVDPSGDNLADYLFGIERMQATAPFIRGDVGAIRGYDAEAALKAAMSGIGDIRGRQMGLADILGARVRGEGQSLAELQLQKTLEDNQRRIAGGLSGTRGLSPDLQRRLITQAGARMQQSAAREGALLRAKEQQDAQTALASLLAGVRGQEVEERKGAFEATARDLERARLNQAAELDRQRIQVSANQPYTEGNIFKIAETAAGAASGAGAAKGAGAGFDGGRMPQDLAMADGGKMPKSKITAAHKMAKELLKKGDFRKRYGKEAESVAYATAMAREKEGKADGGEMKLARLDNRKNDVIPAMLSEGEAVIPRSIMKSSDPAGRSAAFIAALEKNKSPKEAKKVALSGESPMAYVLELEKRIAELEAKLKSKKK